MSRKRQKQNKEYKVLRVDFLQEHPYCQWFMQENGIDEDVASRNCGIVLTKRGEEWVYVSVPRSTQVHHRKGRTGNMLIDIRYFLAVSDEAHKAIHRNPGQSYAKGYMIPR